MKEILFDFFGYIVFFYSIALMASYVIMMYLASRGIRNLKDASLREYDDQLLNESSYSPGVSIVAPAYNEEKTIINNVRSLLDQDYPTFEVVIVNDGSTDATLDELINNFALEEVPYDYVEKVHTRPFRRLFKSRLCEYSRLTVVDKENGGTKADAVNAGLNVASYPYFINTDVDCILAQDAIRQCIKPVLKYKNVIAVSGAMTMSNGCKLKNGRLESHRAPWGLVPLFQTLEYLRSFFVGKMAWSAINGMPNVSGGYGLFDLNIMIAAGGYSADSFAEDMDMLFNAVRYCCDFNLPYRVVQIPETCCWTEGPSNLRILYYQRNRWGRGLIQTFVRHRNIVFHRHFRQLGVITTPYLFIFEFLAPVIEVSGFITFIYLALTGGVNWLGALIIFIGLYSFSTTLAVVTMMYDYISGSTFDKKRDYIRLFGAALLEPFFYHPFITLFSLIGYGKFILNTRSNWGKMTRRGFGNETNKIETNDNQYADARQQN